ncbi:MAG: precorrin-2 C(20)-methyltransferase [Candidatus Nanoarchaeia archaeon]|nr:precorrin-2 C(20)-methyltransferase [Candidatus Jingweiarchaeum tengchongense]
MKKLFAVGVGPGDQELLTLKAVRVLKECDLVFIPRVKDMALAESIVSSFIESQKKVYIDFLMDGTDFDNYSNVINLINKAEFEKAAFITMGDPLTYSTFVNLLDELKKTDLEIEVVPAVTSFTAAFSRLIIPFAKKGQRVVVTDSGITREILESVDIVCLLKAKRNKYLLDLLRNCGFNCYYVKRCYMEGEGIFTKDEDILKDDDYFSILIGVRE